MTISEQQSQAFKEFERTGWAKQAEHYDSLVGEMTRQAVDPLLGAVKVRSGRSVGTKFEVADAENLRLRPKVRC